jgi:porin
MDYLTGDWHGMRQSIHDTGIDLFANYSNDLLGNPSGGKAQGFTNAGSLDAAFIFDFDKIAHIQGCRLHGSLCWRSGSSLSARSIGNAFYVQQLYGGETWKLVELYLQESLFNQKLNLKIGRLCAGNDFAASSLYLRYVMGAINSNPACLLYNAFFSTYPFATWGICVDGQVSCIQAKFGVYNNNPAIWKNRYHGMNLTFESQEGPFFISEGSYLYNRGSSPPGTYTVGGYYVNNLKFNNNYGFYCQFEQMIWQHSPARSSNGLSGWGTFLFAPSEKNLFPVFFAGGLVEQGIGARRPDDAVCFGVAYGFYSSKLADAPTQKNEVDIEVNYWLQATRYLALTSVLQYIIHPSGNAAIPNAWVLGLQVSLDL